MRATFFFVVTLVACGGGEGDSSPDAAEPITADEACEELSWAQCRFDRRCSGSDFDTCMVNARIACLSEMPNPYYLSQSDFDGCKEAAFETDCEVDWAESCEAVCEGMFTVSRVPAFTLCYL